MGVKVDMTAFGHHIGLACNLGFLSYPITLLWIVGISNAVNFIDGVDGLAGSVITVNAITLAIVALAMRPPNSISALIAFILAGSMLAFLTYNFNPAKIFMGDSGALFSGFLLASLSITGVMKGATFAVLLPSFFENAITKGTKNTPKVYDIIAPIILDCGKEFIKIVLSSLIHIEGTSCIMPKNVLSILSTFLHFQSF